MFYLLVIAPFVLYAAVVQRPLFYSSALAETSTTIKANG